MATHENDTANPNKAGGCCCSGKQNSARVAEAGVESFLASDPPAWTLGRNEQPASCCQSSNTLSVEKENRDGHRP
jgi:hypothetical protein